MNTSPGHHQVTVLEAEIGVDDPEAIACDAHFVFEGGAKLNDLALWIQENIAFLGERVSYGIFAAIAEQNENKILYGTLERDSKDRHEIDENGDRVIDKERRVKFYQRKVRFRLSFICTSKQNVASLTRQEITVERENERYNFTLHSVVQFAALEDFTTIEDVIAVEAVLTDEGKGFDPTKLQDVTQEEKLDSLGGRGTLLIETLYADEQTFSDDGRTVRLRRYCEAPSS